MPPEDTAAAENYVTGLGPDFVHLLTLENSFEIIKKKLKKIDDVFNCYHGGGEWNIRFQSITCKV